MWTSWIPFRSLLHIVSESNSMIRILYIKHTINTVTEFVSGLRVHQHIILMSRCYPKITKNDFHFTKLPITKRQLVGQ